MKYIGIFFLSLFMSGCASGPISTLPLFDENIAGKVTVVRIASFLGGANTYNISINGKDVFGIRSGQYTYFVLPEGEHTIGVSCPTTISLTPKPKSFELKKHENLNFLIEPTMTCAQINPIDSDKADELIAKSKYIRMYPEK